MLTAHTIKILQSLDKKKFRQKYNLFLVEGNKIIRELYNTSYKVKEIYSTTPHEFEGNNFNITEITSAELKKISFLQTPKDSVAVCELLHEEENQEENLQIVLDGIQDPGNFGTIIRLADWFGISKIVCSKDTVDLYNPKVLQASKGSFARVKILYTDIETFLSNSENVNVAADLDGENMYHFKFPEKINLIFGNEGNGMREEVEQKVQQKITIPRFGTSTESLNVSMATAIVLGQIFSKR